MEKNLPSPLLPGLLDIAQRAGKAIMSIYASDAKARLKDDATPVTEADIMAENIILAGLGDLAPGVPIVSEESVAAGYVPALKDRFFLVDPLDGTREFLSRNGEFTVNIALIDNRLPAIGVVFAPALPRLFWAERGIGAFEAAAMPGSDGISDARRLAAATVPARNLRVVASRSHRDSLTEEWIRNCHAGQLVFAGSSLKFCVIAAGEADVYPRFGRTMEWDTAAGHAVLLAAGGKILTEGERPLTYGKVEGGFANPAFIASGA
ncbi:MAG: 3'(2'),5'-bisphosphate nucleotidase CysQ [Aestuariivirgaceae bacterium]